jgi:type II pantothenate kinase
VAQTIALMGISVARANNLVDIVLTSKLTGIPQVKMIVETVANLYHAKFHIPNNAGYASANGAAIMLEEKISSRKKF